MSEAATAPAEGEEDVFNFKDAKDVFLGHKQLIADMALVDGALYTAAQDGRIIAFDTYDRSKTDELRAADAVNCLAYAEPNLYCAVGNLVFMVKRGTGHLHTVTYEIEPVHAIAALFALGDMLFVGYNDGSMRQWQQSELIKTWRPHRQAVGGVWATAKRVYSTSADGSAAVLARENGSISVLVEASKRPLRCIIEHAGLVVVASGMNLQVLKKDGTPKTVLKQHTADVHAFVADRDLLFSGAGDRRVVLWSLSKLEALLVVVTGHSNRVKCMALNGSLLYTGSGDKTVRVFDLKEAFVQRAEWQKERKKSAAKVITSIFRGKKPTDARPTSAAEAKPAPTVTTIKVTKSDMDDLANWMAQSQQRAEIDKQKEDMFKRERAGDRPSSRSGSSPAPVAAAAPSSAASSSTGIRSNSNSGGGAAQPAPYAGGGGSVAGMPPYPVARPAAHVPPQPQPQRRPPANVPQAAFGAPQPAAFYPQPQQPQPGYQQGAGYSGGGYPQQQQQHHQFAQPPFGGVETYRQPHESTLYVEDVPAVEEEESNPYANLPNLSNIQPRMQGPRF